LRSAISKITNSALSDIQWLQASMPIAHDGLGGVIARNSCLSSFGGEHPSPPGRHPVIVPLSY